MNEELELTPWFVNGETPARPGVYNVSCQKTGQSGDWFARWDGKQWFGGMLTIQGAESMEIQAFRQWHQRGSWRGLAKDPSARVAAQIVAGQE